MLLTEFIKSLINTGRVAVKGAVETFLPEDLEATGRVLADYYTADALEMPCTAPAFAAEPAIWAAGYFYTAVQLTVLRDQPEAIINQQLVPYKAVVNAEAIYAADLVLRHLPALLTLAKGLAPADILVKELKKTAAHWPFSSVGIELDEPARDGLIFENSCLKQVYADRIVLLKDLKRIGSAEVKQAVLETTGAHLNIIWPGAASFFTTNTV